MVSTLCKNCGGEFQWEWAEAFNKFGFNDSDGQVEESKVENALIHAGYKVSVEAWGLHNTIIYSIKKAGAELVSPEAIVGYDDPYDYSPQDIISFLDAVFPPT